MAWFPRLDVVDGLLIGQTPNGSLNGVPDYLSNQNYSETAEYAMGNGYFQEDYEGQGIPEWPAAYGSNGNGVLAYIKDHGSVSNILLAEFEVLKPDEATYYRQTIAFTFGANYTHYDTPNGSWDYYEVFIDRIQRRQYADPNTPFQVTHEWRPIYNIGALYGCNNVLVDLENFANNIFKAVYFAFGKCSHNNREFFGLFLYAKGNIPDYNKAVTEGSFFGIDLTVLDDAFSSFEVPETEDPNEEPDPDGPGSGGGGGGEGGHHLPQDPIDVPPLPEIGAASVSWLTVYKMSTNDINDFGEELMNPSVIDVLKSFFNDPLDSIVGIILIPFEAPTTRHGTPEVPGLVPYTWSRSFDVVTKEFVELDCGTLYIEPYYDSAFDMNPYTLYHVWLPFIGYREINADEIAGNTIGIKYHIDVLTGDCTAFIYRGAGADNFYGPSIPQVIEQFSGNCGVRVPIGRVSYDAAVNAAFTLLSQGVGMAAGYAASAAGLANSSEVSDSQIANQVSAATMSAVNGAKTAIQRSGAIGGAAAYMGIVKPYIIKEVPRQSLPSNYRKLEGYPANKGGSLSQYAGTGLQVVEVIELDNLIAFESEISEIKTLLKGGVLV